MSKKHHGGPGPIPPGNQPHAGPAFTPGGADADLPNQPVDGGVPGDQEQDPQRRLGGFEGKGEHSRQQPGRLNDGDVHSK